MREIKFNEQVFNVRGLKRREIRELKTNGFDLAAIRAEQAFDAIDAVFNLIFTPDQVAQIDDLPNADALKVWAACLAETYGIPAEEKN